MIYIPVLCNSRTTKGQSNLSKGIITHWVRLGSPFWEGEVVGRSAMVASKRMMVVSYWSLLWPLHYL